MSSSSIITQIPAATHDAWIACGVVKVVFVDNAAADRVMAAVTLHHEVTMLAAATKLRCEVAEKSCRVAVVAPATTAARRAYSLHSA
jgi:adenosine/AMP kinase